MAGPQRLPKSWAVVARNARLRRAFGAVEAGESDEVQVNDWELDSTDMPRMAQALRACGNLLGTLDLTVNSLRDAGVAMLAVASLPQPAQTFAGVQRNW
jgi:hypothetical protein